MADIQKTIEIIFGSTDNLSPGLDIMQGGFSNLDASARKLAQPFADITTSILKFDAALVTAGAGLTAFAINQAGGFSDSLAEIGTLFDGTGDQVDQLSGDLLDFSRDAVFAIDDINAATFTAISTGTDWRDVTDLLTASQKLAVVGATSLGDSTAVLTRSMNAYGAGVEEADRYSEALFTTAQRGDTNLTKLAAALGLVVADAAAANVPIETLGAAVSTLTVGAIDTNRAMTLLKSLFAELLSPSKELEAALGGMTLEGDGLEAVMAKLMDATGGTAKEMGELFGRQEAVTAALILANDNAGTFASTMAAMSDETQSVTQNYEQMADKFDLANQRLKNSLKVALIDFGLPLLDEYGDSVNALGEIFQQVDLSFRDGVFDEVYSVLEGLMERVGTELDNIAENIGEALELVDFSGLADALTDLGDAVAEVFVDIFGEIDTSKPEDLAEAIQVAVNLLTKLVQVTQGILEFFNPIFEAIGEAARRISETDEETAKAAGGFGAAMTVLANFGVVAVAALKLIEKSGADIENVFNVLGGTVKTVFNGLQMAFDLFAGAVVETMILLAHAAELFTIGEVDQEVKDFRKELEYLNAGVLENLKKNATEFGEGVDQISKGLSGATSATEDQADAASKLSGKTKELTDDTKKLAADGFAKMYDQVVAGSRIMDENGDIYGIVGDKLINLSKSAEDAGVSFDLFSDYILDSTSNTIEATQGLEAMGDATEVTSSSLASMNDELRKTDPELAGLRDTLDDTIAVHRGLNGELVFTADGLSGVASSAGDAAKGLELTKEQAADALIKLEEIASNERIKNIEARVELNIAQIEADTQRALAAFDSISTGITSTGDVISDALGVLGGLDANTRVYNDIFSIVEQEYELRKYSFEKQNDLIDEQIDNLRERTKALANGVVLEIKADGMEHEIEAFMYKIVQKIHAKAVGDEAEFLLSIA